MCVLASYSIDVHTFQFGSSNAYLFTAFASSLFFVVVVVVLHQVKIIIKTRYLNARPLNITIDRPKVQKKSITMSELIYLRGQVHFFRFFFSL